LTGGFTAPVRKRSWLALSLAGREDISRGFVAGRSVRHFARRLVHGVLSIWYELEFSIKE